MVKKFNVTFLMSHFYIKYLIIYIIKLIEKSILL